MQLRRTISICLAILGIASLSLAQPKPKVPVNFIYTEGETAKVKVNVIGDGTLKFATNDPNLKSMGLDSAIPVNLSVGMLAEVSTLSVTPDGTGTFNLALKNPDINVNVLGQRIQMTEKGGEFKTFLNGKEMDTRGSDSTKAATPNPFKDAVMQFTVDSKGKVLNYENSMYKELEKDPAFSDLQSQMKNYMMKMNRRFIPMDEIGIGDTWADTTRFEDIPLPIKFSKPLQIITKYQVKDIKDVNGEKVAVIDYKTKNDFTGTSMSFDFSKFGKSAGAMAPMPMNGDLKFTFKKAAFEQSGQMQVGLGKSRVAKISQQIIADFVIGIDMNIMDKPMNMDIQAKGKMLVLIENQN